MMVIKADTPVREIVLAYPGTIPVLEHFGIDYCCGGRHSLAEACTRSKHDVSVVIEELNRQPNDIATPEDYWNTAPLGDLICHIEQKHHAFARHHLILVRELAAKVERRHGPSHPEIYRICQALGAITAELTHHFSCEENVLFPHIEQLESGSEPVTHVAFANMQQPVTKMILDHNQTGDELRMLREAANNYVPPPDACTTFRALYRALEELERDLHQHIHLENNILFPRALKLEGEVPHAVSSNASTCAC